MSRSVWMKLIKHECTTCGGLTCWWVTQSQTRRLFPRSAWKRRRLDTKTEFANMDGYPVVTTTWGNTPSEAPLINLTFEELGRVCCTLCCPSVRRQGFLQVCFSLLFGHIAAFLLLRQKDALTLAPGWQLSGNPWRSWIEGSGFTNLLILTTPYSSFTCFLVCFFVSGKPSWGMESVIPAAAMASLGQLSCLAFSIHLQRAEPDKMHRPSMPGPKRTWRTS